MKESFQFSIQTFEGRKIRQDGSSCARKGKRGSNCEKEDEKKGMRRYEEKECVK